MECRINLGKLVENVFNELEKAQTIFEGDVRCARELSRLHVILGDIFKAKRVLEDALKQSPLDPALHCALALLMTQQFDDTEGAKLEYKAAIDTGKAASEAYLNLGLLLHDDIEEATKIFEVKSTQFDLLFQILEVLNQSWGLAYY